MPKRARTRRHSSSSSSTTTSPLDNNNNQDDEGENLDLAHDIVQGLHDRSNPQTKAWFTNYVKGTVWIGCKLPVVRSVIQDVLKKKSSATSNKKKRRQNNNKNTVNSTTTTATLLSNDSLLLLDNAMQLLQNEACDAKLGGMLLLQEHMPLNELATTAVLDRFDRDLWSNDNDSVYINDWSTADWFAVRVLSKIALESASASASASRGTHDPNQPSSLAHRILNYTRTGQTLWQRRCGLVAFLQFDKHRDKLPCADFGLQIIQAAEDSLLRSPNERFTQTGIAWVLRYVLLVPVAKPFKSSANDEDDNDMRMAERDAARAMIARHPTVWTKEAKKSLVEKLAKSDPVRHQILNLE